MDETLERLGETIAGALPGSVVGHWIAHGELTITATAARHRQGRDLPARRRALPVLQLHRHHRGRLAGARAALRRRLSSAVADPEPAHPGQDRGRRGHAACPRSSTCFPAPTGSSARPTISTACCSPAIPTCGASSPTTASRAIRCARISRSPASSRCATTTSRSAWSTTRCGSPRNSAISISCRRGRARATCRCPATRRRRAGA